MTDPGEQKDVQARTAAYRRNTALESLLREVNELLGPVEERLCAEVSEPRFPTLLIVGPPRSGSTLLTQWLAGLGGLAYPSNLLSRFFGAPAMGARIQMLLTDPRYAHKEELADLAAPTDFRSDLGKTRGALAPNEFWYFWRRFLPTEELRHMTDDEVARIDGPGLRAALGALEAAFGKPLFMKALIVQFHLDVVAQLLPRAIFLHMRRDPPFNIQSILEARVKHAGDRAHWWSVKPAEYPQLLELDPVEQVAGQLFYTHRAIERGLAGVEPGRILDVTYEDFCADPASVHAAIRAQFASHGVDLDADYRGPVSFDALNERRLPETDLSAAAAEYARLESTAD